MKTIKKIASKWYVSSTLAFMIFFVSCQSPEAKNSQVANYSGEELFSGLFFGEGEVVKLVPELYDRSQLKNYLISPEEIEAFKSFQSKAIATIRNSNPGFFESFKKDMTSGNHVQISNALKNSSAVLVKAVETMYGVKQSSFEQLTAELNANTNLKEVVLNGQTLDRKQFHSQVSSLAVSYLDNNRHSDSAKEEAASLVVGPIAIAVAAVALVVITLVWVMVDEQTESVSKEGLLGEQVVNSIASNLSVE